MVLFSGIGTGAFILVSLVVGIRLLAHSRTAHRVPCLSIGLAFLLSAGFGFPLLFAALVMPERLGASLVVVQAAGLVGTNLGAVSLWVFTWRTFRPGSAWAVALVGAAIATLAVSFSMQAATTGFAVPVRSGTWFWLAFATRAMSLFWTAIESLRYFRMMRKRGALGLAEPLVVNRFLLWGFGALAGGVMTGLSAVTIVVAPTAAADLVATLRLVGSTFGLASAVTTWLAFFPPNAYRKRFAADAELPA